MALRIARGLFRLWLVLSVLWIAALCTVTWLELAPKIPPKGLSDWEMGIRPPECAGKDNSQCEQLWVELGRNPFDLFDPPRTGLQPRGGVADLPSVSQLTITTKIRDNALLALLPPVFILMAGTAFVWAFRGFR